MLSLLSGSDLPKKKVICAVVSPRPFIGCAVAEIFVAVAARYDEHAAGHRGSDLCHGGSAMKVGEFVAAVGITALDFRVFWRDVHFGAGESAELHAGEESDVTGVTVDQTWGPIKTSITTRTQSTNFTYIVLNDCLSCDSKYR